MSREISAKKPTCNRVDCQRTANKRPVLICQAVYVRQKRPEELRLMEFGYSACDYHARRMGIDWFVTDETWPALSSTIAAKLSPLPSPGREAVALKWVPLGVRQ